MRVLVTGAGGFVGRRVVARLIDGGHDVVGHGSGACPQDLDIPWVTLDLRQTDPPWKPILQGLDGVIHLAALAHLPARGLAETLDRINNAATTRLFSDCCSVGISRFVFLSSIKACAERTAPGMALREDAVSSPQDVYGQAKRAAELGIMASARSDGTSFVILRPPLVHGPGVRANFRSLMRLCDTALPLPFGGLTENRRSFIALDNLADALVHALTTATPSDRLFHVTDEPPLSTAALISELRSRLGRPARLFPLSGRAFGVLGKLPSLGPTLARLSESLAVDVGAFRRETGWSPPLLPGVGLDRTVAAYLAEPRPRSR